MYILTNELLIIYANKTVTYIQLYWTKILFTSAANILGNLIGLTITELI